jgi:predicted acetyltransferase
MSRDASYGLPADEAEIDELARIYSWSFSFPEEGAREALTKLGRETTRVLREDGRLTAGFNALPMAQWFGGASVSMAGVHAVGVSPEHRGKGVATRLMQAAVREFRDSEYALSALYPAKLVLYRRVGYELAGGRYFVTLKTPDLQLADRKGVGELALRPIAEADDEAVRETYRRFARRESGFLDRGEFSWRRVREPRNQKARGFLVEGDEGVEGYVYLSEKRGEGVLGYDIEVSDIIALTPRACRRLLVFFGDHRSLGFSIRWPGHPADVLLQQLAEPRYRVELFCPWTLRIIDVPRALAARGYPQGVTAELHFAVADDTLPENEGRFVLSVAEGRGEVRVGGNGSLGVDVRGLAALYSGYRSPFAARSAGLLDGPEDDLRTAGAVFAGPAPWMPDMF